MSGYPTPWTAWKRPKPVDTFCAVHANLTQMCAHLHDDEEPTPEEDR